ncbi:MAG: cupin domain-containing protein [Pseudomonadota bacterium]
MTGFRKLNLADAQQVSDSHGDYFGYQMSMLSRPCGSKEIAANLTRVSPGKTAFPAHHHYAQEEHFYILAGEGVVRVGDEIYPVTAQDYLVHLPGGPETAHQLINTGHEDLVYLAISTTKIPEVVGYPDSAKTGVRAEDHPAERFLLKDINKNTIGYHDGENGAAVARILKYADEDVQR